MVFIVLSIILAIIFGIKLCSSVGEWIFLLISGAICGAALAVIFGAFFTSGYICVEPTTPQVYTPIQMNEYYIINNDMENDFYTKGENGDLIVHEIHDSKYNHIYK